MREFHNIDCMEGMKEYPDNHFDLAIVDPPYGVGNWIQVSGNVSPNFTEVKWNNSIPAKKYFNELKRISRNRIIWGANYYNCFERNNGAIVWHKGKIQDKFSQCEIASQTFYKKVDFIHINWQSGFHRANIETILHPCQKPIALYRWLLENYAKPGDLILDTHVGSASSLIACEALGFDYVGYEIDKDYYQAAKKRIEDWRSLPLFDEKETNFKAEQLTFAV